MKRNVTWRPLEERDIPRLRELHAERSAMLGMTEPFPELDEYPFFLTAVCEIDGVVLGCLFFEMEAEVMSIANSPDFMAQAAKFWPALQQGLRLRGVRTVRALVPKEAPSHDGFFRRRGFVKTDKDYSSFMTEI